MWTIDLWSLFSSLTLNDSLLGFVSIREDALARVQTIISQRFAADTLDSQKDDLMELLKKSIKKGGTRECVLAAQGKRTPM